MARSGGVALPLALAAAAAALLALHGPAFVPAPRAVTRKLPGLGAAAAIPAVPALLAGGHAALADNIGDKAARFSEQAYPLAKNIDWGNTPIIASYLATASSKDPKGVATAVDKLLEAGLSMDPALVKAAVAAHDKALDGVGGPGLVTSQANFAAVTEALARMIASADKEKINALRTAFPGNEDLQMSLYSQVDKKQAQAAYEAFKSLTEAVSQGSINGAAAPPVTAESGGALGAAAAKLSDATYPLVSSIDWGSGTPLITRYLSEVAAKKPQAVAKAVDKVLEVGLSMDPKLITAAVAAHDKALDGAVGNPGLVASKADYAAVVEALARLIGSADKGKFNALLTAFPGNDLLQKGLFAGQSGDALAAFDAFKGLVAAVKR